MFLDLSALILFTDFFKNIKLSYAEMGILMLLIPTTAAQEKLTYSQLLINRMILCISGTNIVNNIILIVVNLDPFHTQESYVYLPIHEFSIGADETYQVHDLLTDERFYWQGEQNFVKLDPNKNPVHIFKLIRWPHKEQDFDYF